MKNPNATTLTKVEMIAAINEIYANYYGAATNVTAKAERMVKAKWVHIYEVAWLWRNDSKTDQICRINEHMEFLSSF